MPATAGTDKVAQVDRRKVNINYATKSSHEHTISTGGTCEVLLKSPPGYMKDGVAQLI